MHAITTPNGQRGTPAARVRGSERTTRKRMAVANSERRNVTPSGVARLNACTATAPPSCTESEPAIIARGAGSAGRRAPRATCAGLDMASNIAAAASGAVAPPTLSQVATYGLTSAEAARRLEGDRRTRRPAA